MRKSPQQPQQRPQRKHRHHYQHKHKHKHKHKHHQRPEHRRHHHHHHHHHIINSSSNNTQTLNPFLAAPSRIPTTSASSAKHNTSNGGTDKGHIQPSSGARLPSTGTAAGGVAGEGMDVGLLG